MSYEFKGTPGPWIKVNNKAFVYALNDLGVNRFQLQVDGAHCSDEEKQANAQLIAAAPELFEALKGALQAMDNADAVYGEDALYDAARDAEKALAKATGGEGWQLNAT